MNKKNLIGAAIHACSWTAGYWFAYYVMLHSGSREVYGFIVAWWMACYVGYIANIKVKTAFIVCPIYMVALSASFLTGQNWFYHEPPDSINLFFILIVLGNSLLFISPMLVNGFVRAMVAKLSVR